MKGKVLGAVAGGIGIAILLSVYLFISSSAGQHVSNPPVANQPVLGEGQNALRRPIDPVNLIRLYSST